MTTDQAAHIINTMPDTYTLTQALTHLQEATTTHDTSTDTAEKIIAKYHDMTWRSEIATSMLCSHANRDRYGNSREAKAWQKARIRQELMQSILADIADAGIVLPEWPERN